MGLTGAGGLPLSLSLSTSFGLCFSFSPSFPLSLSSPCIGRGGTGRLRGVGKAGEWLVNLWSFSSLFGEGGT